MTAHRPTRSRITPPDPLSPEAYATFISQIELEAIWLVAGHVDNRTGQRSPRHAEVVVSESAQWQSAGGGFDIQHQYSLHFRDAGQELALIDVTFGLHFASAQPMTEETFAVFRAVNLPINTWPYLRAYVADITGRMAWLPFTLPALKRGTMNQAESDESIGEDDAAKTLKRSTKSRPRRGSMN